MYIERKPAQAYVIAPHVAGVDGGLLLVERVDALHALVVARRFVLLARKAAHGAHARARLLRHLVAARQRVLNFLGQFLYSTTRNILCR